MIKKQWGPIIQFPVWSSNDYSYNHSSYQAMVRKLTIQD
jgi:hypothetical protein